MIRRDKVALWMAMVAVVSAVLAGLTFSQNWLPVLGAALLGAVYGFPVAMWIESKLNHWWLVLLVMVLIPLSYFLPPWATPAAIIVTAMSTIWLYSIAMAEFFGRDRSGAFVLLIKLVTGFWRGIQIVDEGKSSAARIPGPVITVIRPSNAVILEGGTEQHKVRAGPTFFHTDKFEYIRDVIDLRPIRSPGIVIDKAISKDRIPTTVRLTYIFGLRVRKDVRLGRATISDGEERIIRDLHNTLPDWREEVRSILTAATRSAVAGYDLDALMNASHFGQIQGNIRSLAMRQLVRYGIHIHRLTIERIDPPEEILKAQSAAAEEAANAHAWREALLIFANGYAAARQTGMPERVLRREAARRTLEHLARNQNADNLFIGPIIAALKEMMQTIK
ncbi:MAG: hypothetical protein KJZ86_04495 [Caldilineaceae bacterium]|nr:hypothetical protein [Caldilineaceae bacterium]HRJ43202.1 SPFH domain-containing protein [Caldilineaceae bacterium]